MKLFQERSRAMAEQVERRLWTYAPLRASGSEVEVTCHNHIAILRGVVRSRTLKGALEALARQVDGVREVRNELVVDTDLEVELARRLALDERTAAFADGLRARVMLGNADLHGTVARAAESEAVQAVASEVPGVRRVVNHLRVAEAAPGAEEGEPGAPPASPEPAATPAEAAAGAAAPPAESASPEPPSPEPAPERDLGVTGAT